MPNISMPTSLNVCSLCSNALIYIETKSSLKLRFSNFSINKSLKKEQKSQPRERSEIKIHIPGVSQFRWYL